MCIYIPDDATIKTIFGLIIQDESIACIPSLSFEFRDSFTNKLDFFIV